MIIIIIVMVVVMIVMIVYIIIIIIIVTIVPPKDSSTEVKWHFQGFAHLTSYFKIKKNYDGLFKNTTINNDVMIPQTSLQR